MRALKQWVKRTPALLGAYRWLQWRWHVLRDGWGTLVWTRTREVTTPLGFRLTSGLHPAYAQMREGRFEPAETAFLARELEHATVFVDIGANLGYYSLLARQRGRHVLAFEPQPQNLDCLFRNLQANGWEAGTEVFPLALAATPGLLTLYGASGPSASLVRGWAGYSDRFRRIVPVNTLDHVLGTRFAGQPLLIKIDVEGAELGVLHGALATLARTPRPVWLVEVCLGEFHPGGNPDFEALFELFWQHGYQAYPIERQEQPLARAEIEHWRRRGKSELGFNYVFR